MTEQLGHIRFATDILRRLGEELNPNIDQGVIELVKNAYDADALNCTVTIGVDSKGTFLSVEDDGAGMTPSEVVDGWLVLGKSAKVTSAKTALGRVPAGNKGLGRLAALRLGHVAEMVTHPRNGTVKYRVILNWDDFDSVGLVEDVPVPMQALPASQDASGTKIRISKLRKRIGRVEVKRLARSMILLADPFDGIENSFKPTLKAPEFEDLERLVSDRYFSDAEYHLVANVRSGVASVSVVDWRGELLYEASHAEIKGNSSEGPYLCPDASFDLWSFLLSSASFAFRSASITDVRAWLEAFGGVHVYSNGLRVSPYGNSGSDWLDMNVSRSRSPEERPSTNNSIGRVTIDDPRGLLRQKTDRSGFIESREFDDLRQFAIDCLEWMARRRLAAAELKREKNRLEAAARVLPTESRVKEEIKKVEGSVPGDLSTAFNQYTAARDRETAGLRREIQLYRTLSTAGITTATFAHESNGGPLKVIVQAINSIKRRGKKLLTDDAYISQLEPPIESIIRATDSLGVLSQATLRLVDQNKRRVGRVNLHAVILQVLETFKPFLEGRDVEVQTELSPGAPYLRGSDAAIESIVTNLINNSLAAFEKSTAAQRILRVETNLFDDKWEMSVLDNGPGIVGIALRDIWLPGQTRREGGTGLGLTIVRDSVRDLSGSVEAIANGALGGATFKVVLPILGR